MKRKNPEQEVAAFNALYPIGTMMYYWRGAKEALPSDSGPLTSPASVLSGHTAVAWIEGCSGCIALSHVEPVPETLTYHCWFCGQLVKAPAGRKPDCRACGVYMHPTSECEPGHSVPEGA